MRIDAHQHFWNYDPVKAAWINDEMCIIKKDFLPEHLMRLLVSYNIEGCVAIQAEQSEKETEFLIYLAEQHNFIKGVVGWIDLQSEHIQERLEYYNQYRSLKGFRHILQDDSNRSLMLTYEFKRGIGCLNKYDYCFDILVYQDQLSYTRELTNEFPNQKFVLDHLGKPSIKKGEIDTWSKEIMELAQSENVYCKLSGYVTEADWKNWEKEEFYPYFDVVLKAFGVDRIMFGSDWPVCLLAAEFGEVLRIVDDYFTSFSKDERDKIFGNNAIAFYNL